MGRTRVKAQRQKYTGMFTEEKAGHSTEKVVIKGKRR
jgi:hypothetical protein